MGNEPNNGMENHGLTKTAQYPFVTNSIAEVSVIDRKTYPSSIIPQQQEICQCANNFRKTRVQASPTKPGYFLF